MPTYDYECTSSECAHRFEAFQSIKARPLRKCPACGNSVKRLIGSGAGIIFKGSGFYVTDYRSKDYQDKAKADKSSSTSSSSSSDSSSSSSDRSSSSSKSSEKSEKAD